MCQTSSMQPAVRKQGAIEMCLPTQGNRVTHTNRVASRYGKITMHAASKVRSNHP